MRAEYAIKAYSQWSLRSRDGQGDHFEPGQEEGNNSGTSWQGGTWFLSPNEKPTFGPFYAVVLIAEDGV